MADKHVWYACYGSNLSRERFLFLIKGGFYRRNNMNYGGCADKREPIKDRPIRIPHRLYFGNKSSFWRGCGVAFIDPERSMEESTLGRMYLITEEQFERIRNQEGPGFDWYGKVLELGEADGYRIITYTSKEIRPPNLPHLPYLQVIVEGLKETYPDMDDETIEKYFAKCVPRKVARR